MISEQQSGGQRMGQRDGFAAADISRINIMYGCSKGSSTGGGTGSRPPPITGGSSGGGSGTYTTHKPRPGSSGGAKPIKPIRPIKPFRPVKNQNRPGFGQMIGNFLGNIGHAFGIADTNITSSENLENNTI